jgi:hypothetical protein
MTSVATSPNLAPDTGHRTTPPGQRRGITVAGLVIVAALLVIASIQWTGSRQRACDRWERSVDLLMARAIIPGGTAEAAYRATIEERGIIRYSGTTESKPGWCT